MQYANLNKELNVTGKEDFTLCRLIYATPPTNHRLFTSFPLHSLFAKCERHRGETEISSNKATAMKFS